MNRATALATLLLLIADVRSAVVRESEGKGRMDYWSSRADILMDEESLMLGGKLQFHGRERLANQVLMEAKRKEIEDGFADPSQFLPSQSFLVVGSKIRRSPVFKIIEKMPKGAVLHAHDTALVSSEYVFWNITRRPNLYVCDVDGLLSFRFFARPNRTECDWQLLEEVRKNDKNRTVDYRIAKQMSMANTYPGQVFPDGHAAWTKFMEIFKIITPLLTYKPVFEDYIYQGLKELYYDNVLYLELRTTLPQVYDLDGNEYGPLEVARIYKTMAERFVLDHPDFIGMKLIYGPIRKCSVQQVDEYISVARQLRETMPDFVAGFDLVGEEDKGEPLVVFAERLKSLGSDVPVFFHAGETNWYGESTDENLIDAVMLNTKRIGHGYALVKHPKVRELARQKNIAIEVSPISNQVLALVKDLRNHPASVLFAEDFPVVVSNDDPGHWGARGLSYDFYEAFVGIMSRHADIRSLKKLALNSIEYSSMSDDEKIRAYEIFRRKWNTFVQELSDEL